MHQSPLFMGTHTEPETEGLWLTTEGSLSVGFKVLLSQLTQRRRGYGELVS